MCKFYFILFIFFFYCLLFLYYSNYFSFSRHPGYAKYRNVFSFCQARLLWYAESGIDICYPGPRQAALHSELLTSQSENRVAIREIRLQVEESARIEEFMLVYEARHLLRNQLIRGYLNLPELYRRRHREFMFYSIEMEATYNYVLPTQRRHGQRRY